LAIIANSFLHKRSTMHFFLLTGVWGWQREKVHSAVKSAVTVGVGLGKEV
jgi:hypothetical protein